MGKKQPTPLELGRTAFRHEREDLLAEGLEGNFAAYVDGKRICVSPDSISIIKAVVDRTGRMPEYVGHIQKGGDVLKL